MKKLLYTLLVGAMALSSCDKSDGAPEKKPGKKPDDGGKIEKVYKVGDVYPDTTSPIGVVFWVDKTHASYDATAKTSAKGKIVSLDGKSDINWSTENIVTGATSETDGAANTAKILALGSYAEKYPAFAWCVAKNTPAVEGVKWYLPALSELKGDIYANKAILNTTLASIDGAMPLWDDCYLSSTEYDGDDVKYIYFTDGLAYICKKYTSNDFAVRAVSAF